MCSSPLSTMSEVIAIRIRNRVRSPGMAALRRKMIRVPKVPRMAPAIVTGATASTLATSNMLMASKRMSVRLIRSSTGHMKSTR